MLIAHLSSLPHTHGAQLAGLWLVAAIAAALLVTAAVVTAVRKVV